MRVENRDCAIVNFEKFATDSTGSTEEGKKLKIYRESREMKARWPRRVLLLKERREELNICDSP